MTKTQTIMNRIFLMTTSLTMFLVVCKLARICYQELEEWGVTGCAKIEFDDPH